MEPQPADPPSDPASNLSPRPPSPHGPAAKGKSPRKANAACRVVEDYSFAAPASCAKVLSQAGEYVAIPYGNRTVPAWKKPQPRTDLATCHQYDYMTPRAVSCATEKKPMEPYKPNAGRNRLVLPSPRKPVPNTSNIEMFKGGDDRRRFVTNNRNDYRGIHGAQSQNAAVVAQRTKFFHKLQQL
mmetsp:Transcript_73117/g.191664  ORF Transcript_73117/g.191664 Transcript_73117/m.191664 type:complete len:184 (-) Transcript_73117:25-576(-)